ncbi:hypothetical protein [Haloglomus salinum]|uniref:hypothetical protein n=1 Tax=Haloglomus salinum TaxID=2962673 RepID=UPI0020C985CE|nr:hypothetical protein [Haloglomus salinum]
MGDLHERIDEGDYWIEIKETRHGSIVALNKDGERTLSPEEHEELTDLMDEYKQVILDLKEAHEEHEGKPVEQAWAMGKVYKEEVAESDERAMSRLNPLLPFVEGDNRKEYLYRRLYEMFPNKGWNENHTQSMLSEFAQRAGPEKAREIYDRTLADYDPGTKKKEVRLAYSDDYPATPEGIISHLQGKGEEPTVETVDHLLRLRGVEDRPTEETIRDAIDDAQ